MKTSYDKSTDSLYVEVRPLTYVPIRLRRNTRA
jgi:hypothetical protein